MKTKAEIMKEIKKAKRISEKSNNSIRDIKFAVEIQAILLWVLEEYPHAPTSYFSRRKRT